MNSTSTAETKIRELETGYRKCACRSFTPFFSVLMHGRTASSHNEDENKLIYRTIYQHDRDKILYSKPFRRLRLKSQIFPEHTSDHLRTRMDHTLEVAQIARHFARQLNLNEDLVDAIALGHDLGHAPFAHSGERALHNFCIKRNLDGYKHNWQGLRLVDIIEKSYPEHSGLNLARATRLGILKHTSFSYGNLPQDSCSCDMKEVILSEIHPKTLDQEVDLFEIQTVSYSDEIGQILHDFEDGLLSNIYEIKDIVESRNDWPLIGECLYKIERRNIASTVNNNWTNLLQFDFKDDIQKALLIARLRSEIIYLLANRAITEAKVLLIKFEADEKISSEDDFNNFITSNRKFPKIFELKKEEPLYKLKAMLTDMIVKSERVSRMDGKADYILHKILEIYLSKPMQCPQALLDRYAERKLIVGSAFRKIYKYNDWENLKTDKDFMRACVDYVGGMTDRNALQEFDKLYSAYPRNEF